MKRRALDTRSPAGLMLAGMALGAAGTAALLIARLVLPSGAGAVLPGVRLGLPRSLPAPTPPPAEVASAYAELAARGLEFPVAGGSRDAITDSFLDSRFTHIHHAIDIMAPRNTPVRAADAGTVLQLSRSLLGGISIYQADQAERYCFFYAHLQGYAPGLSEGQSVARGQVIGYVGTTGNAPAGTPHLHFAIYLLDSARRCGAGTAINPYPLLAQRH
jgi:murein DD-endopeptidase MepM/ murein hydrolase activator NlpD